jgi:hypothetical protein
MHPEREFYDGLDLRGNFKIETGPGFHEADPGMHLVPRIPRLPIPPSRDLSSLYPTYKPAKSESPLDRLRKQIAGLEAEREARLESTREETVRTYEKLFKPPIIPKIGLGYCPSSDDDDDTPSPSFGMPIMPNITNQFRPRNLIRNPIISNDESPSIPFTPVEPITPQYLGRTKKVRCVSCDGDGRLFRQGTFTTYHRDCPDCGGKGSTREPDYDERSLREKWHDGLGCYLTTACIRIRGLPDDCHELMILRKFRDGVMTTRHEGREDIQEYKRVAPEIVRRLDLIGNPTAVNEVYSRIYHATILPAVRMIQSGDFQRAYEKYKSGVLELKVLTGVE